MIDLNTKKQTLKIFLAKGIDIALNKLKEDLLPAAPHYNDFIAIKSRYQDCHKRYLNNTADQAEIEIEKNKIREALLNLIDELTEKDFKDDGTLIKEEGPKKGAILYRIPRKMALDAETKSLIRIAFDKKYLLDGLTESKDDVVDELRRISDTVCVELVDPNNEKPFAIRNISEPIQLVDINDFTEWVFYITPLIEGEFPLCLKVTIIEFVNDKERKKDIVLEEQIVVVTKLEATANSDNEAFVNSGFSLNLSSAFGFEKDAQSPTAAAIEKENPGMKSNGFSNLVRILGTMTTIMVIGFFGFNFWKGTAKSSKQLEQVKEATSPVVDVKIKDKINIPIPKLPDDKIINSENIVIEDLVEINPAKDLVGKEIIPSNVTVITSETSKDKSAAFEVTIGDNKNVITTAPTTIKKDIKQKIDLKKLKLEKQLKPKIFQKDLKKDSKKSN